MAASELVPGGPEAGRGRPVAQGLSGKEGPCSGLAPLASRFSRSPLLQGMLPLLSTPGR